MRSLCILFFLFLSCSCLAQKDSSDHFINPNIHIAPEDSGWKGVPVKLNKRLCIAVVSSEAAIGIGSMIALNSVWYKDYPRTSFHFFDDSREWLQMDKYGHVITAYTIGKTGIALLKKCGVSEKKAAIFGGSLGLIYQSGLEVLDGYSSGWGFSWSDMAANATGAIFCTGQELLWQQQRLTLKFSYHDTYFPNYRPEELGNSEGQRIFKDYNGQTYWLSASISSFIKKENKFPGWLDVAFGCGAYGMTGGKSDPSFNNKGMSIPVFERYRKFYFSLDADLWRIKKMPRFLKIFTQTFGFIKIPFPALEFSKKGVVFLPLYF